LLGYTYKDIQAFGNSLTWAIDTAKSQGDEQNYKQLLIVWDFFEGLLAEGYIDDLEDDVPNEAMDYAEEMELMGLDQ
jgi:hypothetical protein